MNLIKFFIDQHGCAKNQVDGELIIANLEKAGYKQTFNSDEAQLIIINSCGFIESAKQECLEAVFSARQQYPKAKILLAGCLAERYGNDLNESLPEVDGFFGNGDISEISNVVTSIFNDKKTVVIPPQKGVCCGDRKMFLAFPGSAFVKITEGCNNRCSFCAIPIIRGELRSRNSDEIIKEIKELVSNGIYEINLIGQDLAAYGTGAEDNVFGTGRTYLPNGTPGIIENSIKIEKKESGLCTLLKRISELEGTFVVRLLYIHPDHFNFDIVECIKKDDRILPYFDIPFQREPFHHDNFQCYKKLKTIIKRGKIDVIISDNRFGLWNSSVESIYITHQIMIKMPLQLKFFEPLLYSLHKRIIEKYDHCWIPDLEGENNLSGDLSHKYPLPKNSVFIGFLSRFEKKEFTQKSPFQNLILISGPEPQRTIFEKEMMPNSYDIKSKIGVVFQDIAVFDELTVYENIDEFFDKNKGEYFMKQKEI